MNAIQSWLKLCPPCEIFLFGKEEGTAEVAAQFGIRHIPEVECTELGTPLVSALFTAAQEIASHQAMCYINGDIILMNDFMQAVKGVRRKKHKFLVIGQRWDVDLREPLNFNKTNWDVQLQAYVAQYGALHKRCGIDYFVFSRGQWGQIPPFAIGRANWDNWLIYHARSMGIPVIDATDAIHAVHQNHDYSHHPGGKQAIYFDGPEVRRNRLLLEGPKHAFTITDATWVLDSAGIHIAIGRFGNHLDKLPLLFPLMRPLVKVTRKILNLTKAGKIARRISKKI